MPVFPDAPAFELAPDWVCEILSPATRRFDLTEKRELYRVNGVAHLWLVDPDARTLEAFALTAGAWTLAAATATAAAETFRHPAGVELPLPQGWQVQSEGGLTVLMPSEAARDASGPKEIYLFAISPTYGVSRVMSSRLSSVEFSTDA